MKNTLVVIVFILSNISIALSQSPDASKPTLDSLQTLKWDWNTLQLEFDSKRLYIYDSSENMIEETYFEWDIFLGQWDSTEQYQYTFDMQGNPLTFITNKLASQQITKIEYTYDGNQNLILELKSKYDGAQWNNWVKIESTYNNDNKIIEFIEYGWNSNQWNLSKKETFLYNTFNNPVVKTIFAWNSSSSSWLFFEENRYTYDSSQNKKLDSAFYWESSSNSWFANSTLEYDYDINGKEIKLTLSGFAGTAVGWSNFNRYSWGYDTFGNVFENEIETWINDSVWVFNKKIKNNYNNNYQKSDLILPLSIPSVLVLNQPRMDPIQPDFNHMLNENLISFWNNAAGNWQESEKRWYFYSDHLVNSINEITDNKLQVYPNPFTHNISFNIAEVSSAINLELYDIQGRKVFSSSINNNGMVNLEGLSSGIYIYYLITDEQQFKGKIIKE